MPGMWLVPLLVYLLWRLVELALSILNLRHLARHGHQLPAAFFGYADQEILAKMRAYTSDRAKLGVCEFLLDTAMITILFFGGPLPWYTDLVTGLGWPLVWSGVVFFLGLGLGATLLQLPFSWYRTFVLEERYGFNHQSMGLWLLDLLKSLLLSIVLGGLLLAGLFWIIQTAPTLWWLIGWASFGMVTLFLLYLSPYLIEPLFNTFEPISDQELADAIRRLLGRAGLTVSRVFTMDASRRSGHSNAYFSGIGRVKRIILFDTLLRNHDRDEILAILAHEAGHWRKKHLLQRLVLSQAAALAGFLLLFLAVQTDWLGPLFGLAQPTLPAKLLLAGFLGKLLLFPGRPLANLHSRRQEKEADSYALQLTESPQALAKALIKLGRDNLANLHPHPWYAAFHYSHPPLASRVAGILAASRRPAEVP